MQPERRIAKKIRQWVLDRGGVAYNIHGGDNFQEAGIPDLLCCWYGRFVGIEVKQPGGKLSRIQQHQLERIRQAGGIVIVAETLDEVKTTLLGVRDV
jgi:VRR-NUC domain